MQSRPRKKRKVNIFKMSKQAIFMKLLSVSIIFVPNDVVDLKLSVRKVLTQVMDSNPSAGKGFLCHKIPSSNVLVLFSDCGIKNSINVSCIMHELSRLSVSQAGMP